MLFSHETVNYPRAIRLWTSSTKTSSAQSADSLKTSGEVLSTSISHFPSLAWGDSVCWASNLFSQMLCCAYSVRHVNLLQTKQRRLVLDYVYMYTNRTGIVLGKPAACVWGHHTSYTSVTVDSLRYPIFWCWLEMDARYTQSGLVFSNARHSTSNNQFTSTPCFYIMPIQSLTLLWVSCCITQTPLLFSRCVTFLYM